MKEVYKLLDSGKSVREVAAAYGVSPSTLYNMHAKYQVSYTPQTVEEILNSIYYNMNCPGTYLKRPTLTNHKRAKIMIDMDKAYEMIDAGESIKSVAESFQISVSTLRRRHLEYQASIRSQSATSKEDSNTSSPKDR